MLYIHPIDTHFHVHTVNNLNDHHLQHLYISLSSKGNHFHAHTVNILNDHHKQQLNMYFYPKHIHFHEHILNNQDDHHELHCDIHSFCHKLKPFYFDVHILNIL